MSAESVQHCNAPGNQAGGGKYKTEHISGTQTPARAPRVVSAESIFATYMSSFWTFPKTKDGHHHEAAVSQPQVQAGADHCCLMIVVEDEGEPCLHSYSYIGASTTTEARRPSQLGRPA